MAILNCAISGISISIQGLDSITIPTSAGYYHPIFAASHSQLYALYSDHCKGKLTYTDSYLLFLAFMHSSDQVIWKHPVTLVAVSPATAQLVENNIAQLLSVLQQSAVIVHPSFIQPNFVVSYENSDLSQITSWIEAWKSNIEYFKSGLASMKEQEELQALENKLEEHILSGSPAKTYSTAIANWACRAADFPPAKAEAYKAIIRTCYSPLKMFNTELAAIKEVEEFCHCNIEPGSIHFHELCKILEAGRSNHIDYLGDFTLLPTITDDSELPAIVTKNIIDKLTDNAPTSKPVESDYPSSLAFLKAKLAYRMKQSKDKAQLEGL